MTSKSALEQLPSHVASRITLYVELYDSTRDSLRDLCLVSKTLCGAANVQLFRHIRFTLDDNIPSSGDCLQVWSTLLESRQALRFVRVLTIKKARPQCIPPVQYNAVTTQWKVHDRSMWDNEQNLEDSMIATPQNLALPSVTAGSRGVIHETTAKTWRRLIQLVKDLPGLRDIVYQCRTQIPPVFLTAIEDRSQPVRLHMHTFSLPSLIYPKHNPPQVDSYELALARSRVLHSLAFAHADYTSDGNANYNLEAVLQMVKGHAPNLKRVSCFLVHPGGSRAAEQAYRTPKPPWTGLDNFIQKEHVKGSLHTLTLIGTASISLSTWQLWRESTDFRVLGSLEVSTFSHPDTLRSFATMARNGELFNLHSLSIRLQSSGVVDDTFDSLMGSALQALPQLQSLNLRGIVGDKSMEGILSHKKSSLRHLTYLPSGSQSLARPGFSVTSDVVRRLALVCTNLQELHIVIRKSRYDETEKAIYRALGRMTHLKHITLNCGVVFDTNQPLDDNEYDCDADVSDGDDRPVFINGLGAVSKRSIQEAFQNIATDQYSARDIYKRINGSSLKSVKLIPECFGTTSIEFKSWMRWLGRHWMIEKLPFDDERVTELDAKDRMTCVNVLRRVESEQMLQERKLLVSAWHGLWPRRKEEWWNDWQSIAANEVI